MVNEQLSFSVGYWVNSRELRLFTNRAKKIGKNLLGGVALGSVSMGKGSEAKEEIVADDYYVPISDRALKLYLFKSTMPYHQSGVSQLSNLWEQLETNAFNDDSELKEDKVKKQYALSRHIARIGLKPQYDVGHNVHYRLFADDLRVIPQFNADGSLAIGFSFSKLVNLKMHDLLLEESTLIRDAIALHDVNVVDGNCIDRPFMPFASLDSRCSSSDINELIIELKNISPVPIKVQQPVRVWLPQESLYVDDAF